MLSKTVNQAKTIESTPYIWQRLFTENQIPKDGVIIEVAPGYEPKIGNALAMFGFRGAIFLVEPDLKAARHIQKIYQEMLPRANIRTVIKALQNVEVGVDVPQGVGALVASHPFDDMVISFIAQNPAFFSQEKEDGAQMNPSIKKFYDVIEDDDYAYGIRTTVAVWKQFIENAKPNYFMASQYPSHTLIVKKLIKRQWSGFVVLEQLKRIYPNSLVEHRASESFGYKGNPKWWILAKNPHKEPGLRVARRPMAIRRLGELIFIPQQARQLRSTDYDIVYVDNKYFVNLDYDTTLKLAREFAITLDNEASFSPETIIAYADRQKDKTDIALTGNCGSGRAVYYGDVFNILGVGKTTLCRSNKPSHSTGRLELMGAMRRIILSKWINFFTKRAPIHPMLIAFKETAMFKWNQNPIPLALLLRIDNGSLDRPSHIEQNPQISINFKKTLDEYAKLDAEYFAYRMMLGAWSTSNYSLSGHVIDLESASFVKYRGPYYTSSSKYPHTRFGYEGLGFIRILSQLVEVKNIKIGDKDIESMFYRRRRQHLSRCFLSLLGVTDSQIQAFFSKHRDYVTALSDQFEKLAKKISHQRTSINLYEPIYDDEDPALLDMSNFFRSLADLYKSPFAEDGGFDLLVRKNALVRTRQCAKYEWPDFIKAAVVTRVALYKFLRETRDFIRSIFQLLDALDSGGYLGERSGWGDRLLAMNRDLPVMFELNDKLKRLTEEYRLGKISAATLNIEISKLCELPMAT